MNQPIPTTQKLDAFNDEFKALIAKHGMAEGFAVVARPSDGVQGAQVVRLATDTLPPLMETMFRGCLALMIQVGGIPLNTDNSN